MIAGITKETLTGERRVAVVPGGVPALKKLGLDVLVERGAGAEAGFPDAEYEKQGATLAGSRDQVFAGGRHPAAGAHRRCGRHPYGLADVERLSSGHRSSVSQIRSARPTRRARSPRRA